MNNRLVGAGIGLVLIIILIFIVVGTGGKDKTKGLPELKAIQGLISKDNLDEAKEKIDEFAAKNPGADTLGEIYYELANAYKKNGNIVKARDAYRTILRKYQNVDNILEVQESLGHLNIEILFSPRITDTDILYEVEPGDTLSKIAKKFGTTVDLIKAANSLKSDIIQARSNLKISKAKYKILVDKSQNILTLLSDNEIMKVYQVSTGENNSTPLGTFKIINRIKDPVWYTQGAIVPAESPDNILGSRWLGFSKPGYGIHGTVDPKSVGRQATKGCIRMLNSDVEELYTIIPIGTEVTIVD